MFRSVLLLFLMILFASITPAAASDEIATTLNRAESLYYEARFKESIEMLQHADDLLHQVEGRESEKRTVKVQLALAYIGLNDTIQAKAVLRDVYAADPEY